MTILSHGLKFTDNGELVVVSNPGGTTGSNNTATLANVASSATSVTILAANENRSQAMLTNDSTQVLYLKFGSTAASTTSYTVQIASNGYYELPSPTYKGELRGIWASANGNARITEVA